MWNFQLHERSIFFTFSFHSYLLFYSVYNIFRIFTISPHSTRSDKEELFFHHCARRLYFSSIIIVIFSEECLQWISIFHISVFMDDGVRSWHQSRARAIDECRLSSEKAKAEKKEWEFHSKMNSTWNESMKVRKEPLQRHRRREKIFKFDISINHIRRFSVEVCVEFQKSSCVVHT